MLSIWALLRTYYGPTPLYRHKIHIFLIDDLFTQIFFTANCFVYPNCISSFVFSHRALDVFGSLIVVAPWVTTMNSPFSLVDFLLYFLQEYFIMSICAVVPRFYLLLLGFCPFSRILNFSMGGFVGIVPSSTIIMLEHF